MKTIFSHLTWDYNWTHPPKYQEQALKLAEAHPFELSPREVAYSIATAPTSEWYRVVEWFYNNSETSVDAVEDVREPIKRMCELLIKLVQRDWHSSKGWWCISSYDKRELAELIESNQLLMDFLPQYFSRWTRQGIRLIQILLTEQVAIGSVEEEPMDTDAMMELREKRHTAQQAYIRRKKLEQKPEEARLATDDTIPF